MLHPRQPKPRSATDSPIHLADSLVRCHPFSSVPREQIAAAIRRHHYRVNHYRRDAIMAFRGDHYDRLLVLLSGAARSEMSSYHGKRYTVAEHSAPCVLAPAFLFGAADTLPVSIVCTADAELLRLPRSAVLDLCRQHSAFLQAFLAEVSDRLAALAEKLRLSRLATLRERVADYLLDASDVQGTRTVQLPHTRQALAEIMGVTRPALSRVFGELAEAQLIQYDRGALQILDPDGLRQLVPE